MEVLSSKRQSYTIKRKLLILAEYGQGESGKGLSAIAKKYGISRDTLHGCVKKRSELEATLRDRDVESRRTRRLQGGGRKSLLGPLEDRLYEWIRDKNHKGLKVKDSYIRAKARSLHQEMAGSVGEDEALEIPIDFDASVGWLGRFKDCIQLVSHCRTTSRVLPDDAREQARAFIQSIHALIDKHKIKEKNVINFDQVPKYFEVENSLTITARGSKQVILRKGGSSHKRFTTTFAVTASGEFLKPHVLFSKLKNRPKVPDGILCDVNMTRMWNDQITWRFFEEAILSRRETAFYREPILIIFDAYSSHKAIVDSGRLKAYNVFTLGVPRRMTSIVQQLDVGVNRSFQTNYASRFDTYLAQVIDDPTMHTPAGNPKVPDYNTVSKWVLEWITNFDIDSVRATFIACGILPSQFEMDALHTPLKELLSDDFSMETWVERHVGLLAEDENNEAYVPPMWHLPNVTSTSLYKCMLIKLHRESLASATPTSLEISLYRDALIGFMQAHSDLCDITDEEYYAGLHEGRSFPGELELFAACQKENVNIHVSNAENTSTFEYKCLNPSTMIYLVRFDDYYGVKLFTQISELPAAAPLRLRAQARCARGHPALPAAPAPPSPTSRNPNTMPCHT